jgi:DNA-binding MarR family transcriptional regulator
MRLDDRYQEEATMDSEEGGDTGLADKEDGKEGFAAWSDVCQSYTLVSRAVERKIRGQFGLPLAGFDVLAQLAKTPEEERVRMQELARRVLLSKSGLSQLFTRLEKRGLVERRGDPENLRVTYAIITQEGRRTLERALPAFHAEVAERFGSHLEEEEIRTLRRAMRKVIRASGEEPLSNEPGDARSDAMKDARHDLR